MYQKIRFEPFLRLCEWNYGDHYSEFQGLTYLNRDKLDKMPWADVKKEMVDEKGLPEEVADKIGEWVVLKGGKDLLEKLQKDESLAANDSMKQGMTDMGLLFEYLECYGVTGAASFDLSLARGLDYYTGIIFESTFYAAFLFFRCLFL